MPIEHDEEDYVGTKGKPSLALKIDAHSDGVELEDRRISSMTEFANQSLCAIRITLS